MADSRSVISGSPGTTWQNETDKVFFQFHVEGRHTCGVCYQYSEQIARFWPIPIHANCRCKQSPIAPGASAPREFVDYEKVVAKLPPHEQAKVMGKSAYCLVRKGVVSWSEVVTSARVRTLEEVVSRNKLDVKTMVKAGIQPGIAERAHGAVNTPEHVLAEQHRRQQVARIVGLTGGQTDLSRQLAEHLASRVGIAAGPSYTTKSGAVLPGIQAQTLVSRQRLLTDFAALLALPNLGPPVLKKKKRDQEEDQDGLEQH